MSAAFEQQFTVPSAAIDGNGHVNNVEYVRWMQDVAKAHAEACGGAAVVRAIGATWVVRSHHIEYLRPLFEGDGVRIRTWVESFDRVSSLRNYELLLLKGGALVARGQTKWVLIDTSTGRLRNITRQIVSCFNVEGIATS